MRVELFAVKILAKGHSLGAADRGVVIRDVEVPSAVHAPVVLADDLVAELRAVLCFNAVLAAPAVLCNPCACSRRRLWVAELIGTLVEIARGVVVVPAHDGNLMVCGSSIVHIRSPGIHVCILCLARLVWSGGVGTDANGDSTTGHELLLYGLHARFAKRGVAFLALCDGRGQHVAVAYLFESPSWSTESMLQSSFSL